MTIFNFLISALIGYFCGCFQTAYLVGKYFKKIDIRQHGSNNAGASNVTTVMGWKYGVITALIDITKAVLAIMLVEFLFPDSKDLVFVAGAAVILGHIFPVFLKFRGGKGLASLVGMLLAVDIKIALFIMAAIAVITLVTDYIAVGSLTAYSIVPLFTFLSDYPTFCTMISLMLVVLAFYKHHINIKRILRKEETGLRSIFKK